MKRKLGVGVIGCGNVSTTYLGLAPLFRSIEMRACADRLSDMAEARAQEFGIEARSVERLLASDDIDIVVNLTVPDAHAAVSRRALEAGKHVFSEKPYVLSVDDGRALQALAEERNLRIGSAPDTFLGSAAQQARALLDAGAIGSVTSATAHVMSRGMEHWHPNPGFFYQPGAGPVLDVGPYYITHLVQLLGPVSRVVAGAATPSNARTVTAEDRLVDEVPVGTPTTVHAVLECRGGALVSFGASWDVRHHSLPAMELHGEFGSLTLPDPNYFGGTVDLWRDEATREALAAFDHPFAVPNQELDELEPRANYRTAGLADMASAILEDRPHRCHASLALHAVDVMTSILEAAASRRSIEIGTSCERPAPLSPDEARALLV